jgi:hypothetical protein
MKKVKIKVEFDPCPIRHAVVQCPNCEKWFYPDDILTKEIHSDYDLYQVEGTCPICGHHFNSQTEIEECSHSKIYDGVMKKKVIWE